jgi:hypothetical protein
MKHPLLENRTRFFVWWLAWLILAAGQSLVIHFGYGIPADYGICRRSDFNDFFGILGLAVWFPLRFLLKEDNQSIQQL